LGGGGGCTVGNFATSGKVIQTCRPLQRDGNPNSGVKLINDSEVRL
jgi:hypothetical protein